MRLLTLLLLCVTLIGHAQELPVYKGEVMERNGLSYKPFSNDPLTAKVEQYYENGQLKHLYTVIDGKKEGLYQEWHENGQLETKVTYVNGKREGLQHWYNKDIPRVINHTVMYVNGKREGLDRLWHKNGQLFWEVTYVNGKKEGLERAWLENGESIFGIDSCYKADEKTDMSYCKEK